MRKSILNILAFLTGALLLPHLFLWQGVSPGHDLSLRAILLLLLGGLGGISVRFWLLQRRRSREQEANFALVVRIMRRIHLLLVERKGSAELLDGICRILTDEGHYLSAWIAVMNREGMMIGSAEAGLGKNFLKARQDMGKGAFPVCAKKAMSGREVVVSGPDRCPGCVLALDDDADRVCFTVRLICHDQIYGLLSVSTSATRERDGEEQRLFGEIARDVGLALYLLELEAQRANTENRFQELVENSLAGILLLQDNAIIYRNPEQRRLFGPLPASFRPDVFTGVHPDDLEKVKDAYGKVSCGEVASVDLDFRFYPQPENDGVRVMKWVFCRASRIEYQDRETLLVNMIDITRNKELEHLVQIQDKMSSLGRVAAGIAHEIRNPLSGINIYFDTLTRIYERGGNLEEVGEIITQAQAASGKIESVIRRVMDFSKPGQPRLMPADVNQPVENALSLCALALAREGVGLERELATDLPRCRIDANLIEQVILNLLTNVLEALRHAEVKRISVRTALAQEAVVIRVGDSGPGIPKGLRDKVFEPFYTTKSDGTGIGLSLCRRIINDHHGTLSVEESAWGGAEFVIALGIESAQKG